MLIINALLVDKKILMKLKSNKMKILNVCDCIVDIKLSMHFGDDKLKSILFETKINIRKVRKLDIRYGDIKIKHHSKFKYLR